MTDLTFDVQAARRRARRRVLLLRVGLLGILGLFGAGYVVLGTLVFEHVRWIADVPEIGIYLVVVPVLFLWETYRKERLRLTSCTAVARMLGAREVSARAASDAEHTLRNVAEEIAIAAGVPVPRLYIVPGQPGINALAVGTDVARGGVFVTSAAVQELSRDALQAVVAHELAHLITRDASLHAVSAGVSAALRATLSPIRVAARGFGSLLPSLTGSLGDGSRLGFRFVLAAWCLTVGPVALLVVHALTATSGTLLISGDVLRALATLILGTTVLGSVGWLLAQSTDLAVSKESEFGADALAVELTRHPDALAEALRAIRDSPLRGLLLSPAATRLRPFFFARADAEPAATGHGSHPSPNERLGALKTHTAGRRWHAPVRARSLAAPKLAAPTLARATQDPLGDASRLLDTLPYQLCDAAHDSVLAEPLAYALLLDQNATGFERQKWQVPITQFASARDYHAALAQKPTAAYLALLEIALPALRRLGAPVRRRLLDTAEALAGADGRMTVRETALCEVLHHALAPRRTRRMPSARHVLEAASVLLSALAYSGTPIHAERLRAFKAGAAVVRESLPGTLPPLSHPNRPRLRGAFAILIAADGDVQTAVLNAARVTVWTDGRALSGEADLVRALALALGRPALLPPQPGPRAARAAAVHPVHS